MHCKNDVQLNFLFERDLVTVYDKENVCSVLLKRRVVKLRCCRDKVKIKVKSKRRKYNAK